MKAAAMSDAFLAQQQIDLLDPLAEPGHRLVGRAGETAELVRQEGAGEADIEAPARDRVEHRDLTRQLQRVIERRQHRAGDEPRPLSALRRGGEEDDRVGAIAAIVVEVMLDDADVRVAEAVRLFGNVERLAEILLSRAILGSHVGEELHAELHSPPPPQVLFGRDAGADRAADPGPAKPAIAERVLRQILLVIILGEIELRRLADFGRDGVVSRALEPRLIALARGLGGLQLLRRIGIDRRAVLRPDVIALAHALGGIMALPEELQQPVIADRLRVEDDEHDLGVPGASAAYLLVGRVHGRAAGIADRSGPHARRLPEFALGTPEAAEPEYRHLQPRRIGAF